MSITTFPGLFIWPQCFWTDHFHIFFSYISIFNVSFASLTFSATSATSHLPHFLWTLHSIITPTSSPSPSLYLYTSLYRCFLCLLCNVYQQCMKLALHSCFVSMKTQSSLASLAYSEMSTTPHLLMSIFRNVSDKMSSSLCKYEFIPPQASEAFSEMSINSLWSLHSIMSTTSSHLSLLICFHTSQLYFNSSPPVG